MTIRVARFHSLGPVVLGALLALTAWVPAPVGAVPLFEWQSPYEVAFSQTGSGTHSFGANFAMSLNGVTTDCGLAPVCGQAGDIGPATAVLRAFADARGGVRSQARADVSLHFNRRFELSGSPNGWDLSITGSYKGFLGLHLSSDPFFDVALMVATGGGPRRGDEQLGFQQSERLGSDQGYSRSFLGSTSISIEDGDYFFSGGLAVTSVSDSAGLFGFTQAFTDFFSLPPGFGLFITFNATPRNQPLPPLPPPPPPPILVELPLGAEFFVSASIPPEEVSGPPSVALVLTGLAVLLSLRRLEVLAVPSWRSMWRRANPLPISETASMPCSGAPKSTRA